VEDGASVGNSADDASMDSILNIVMWWLS
jgi:hypothetical protein